LHIHKAAGSSLVSFVENSEIQLFEPSMNGIPLDSGGGFRELWLNSSDDWKQFHSQELQARGFEFFSNEMYLGRDFFRILHLFDFVTILRHPVDRWLSDYFHQCEDRAMPSLEDLIAGLPDVPPSIDATLQPNYLCCQLTFPEAARWAPEALAEEAISRLKHFSLIMFQSILSCDIHEFCRIAEVHCHSLPYSNCRGRLNAREYLPPDLYARLCRFHDADFEVYNYFWQARMRDLHDSSASKLNTLNMELQALKSGIAVFSHDLLSLR